MRLFVNFNDSFGVNIEELSDIERFASFDSNAADMFIEGLMKSLKINQEYGKITFCQMILIETLINNIKDQKELIPRLLAVFYRPTDEKVFDNDDNASEELKINAFKEMPAGTVYKLYNDFTERRDEFINKRYKGIIYNARKSDEESGPVEETPESRFNKAFFWYERQRSIAKELNMKMQDVLLMSANEAMYEIAYQVNKAKIEEMRRKQQETIKK